MDGCFRVLFHPPLSSSAQTQSHLVQFFPTPPFLEYVAWVFFGLFLPPSSPFLSLSLLVLLLLCTLSASPAAVVLNWCCSVSAFILLLVFPFSPPSALPSLFLSLLRIPNRKRQVSDQLPPAFTYMYVHPYACAFVCLLWVFACVYLPLLTHLY